MNKLYQASKSNRNNNPVAIPQNIRQHPDFKKNTKQYYGLEQSDTASDYVRNQSKFYANGQQPTQDVADGFRDSLQNGF